MDIGKLNFNNIYATRLPAKEQRELKAEIGTEDGQKYAASGSSVNNIKTPKDFETGKVDRHVTPSGHVNIPKPISSYVTPVDFVGRMDAFDKASVNRPEQRSEFVGNNIYTMA